MTDSQSIEAMFPKRNLTKYVGEHFNKPGHSQLDMLPVILEEVTSKNDDLLTLNDAGFLVS